VDELAADIFVGEFSVKFLQAAKIAARLLQNSLYERYFGLSYERVLHITDVPEGQGPRVSPEFARLCEELAGTGDNTGRSVARNGKVIEQAISSTPQSSRLTPRSVTLRQQSDLENLGRVS